MKNCTVCKTEKPITEFEKGRAMCKPCRLLKKKEAYRRALEKGIHWGTPHKDYPIFKRLAVNANRTAHQRGAMDNVTAKEIEDYLGTPETCYLCGLSLTFEEVQIEHIYPIIKGGTNTINNLAYIHPRCNRVKSGSTKEELKELLKNIIKHL